MGLGLDLPAPCCKADTITRVLLDLVYLSVLCQLNKVTYRLFCYGIALRGCCHKAVYYRRCLIDIIPGAYHFYFIGTGNNLDIKLIFYGLDIFIKAAKKVYGMYILERFSPAFE